MWKAAGLGGSCGGLPAVRGGFQPDAAGFSHLQRGGVRLYGDLCRAAKSPRKVKTGARSKGEGCFILIMWMDGQVCVG